MSDTKPKLKESYLRYQREYQYKRYHSDNEYRLKIIDKIKKYYAKNKKKLIKNRYEKEVKKC